MNLLWVAILCLAVSHRVGAQDAPHTPAPGPDAYLNPEVAPRPSMHPTKVMRAPRIDGVLDEPEWRSAQVLTDFRQQLPNTGLPATFRTEVRVLYDADHLYVAAENFDPEPARAISAGLERDFNTGDSDIFGLALDTFHDRRNAFLFAINPMGGIRDEQVFNDSRTVVEAWEGIIALKTRMTDSSWIAELAIPMRTLRFDGSLPVQDWGANFIRR
ncbi:MAG: carbohydrate binding family 9 domain-containing protein, partial [Gemmatimonadota bacterium]